MPALVGDLGESPKALQGGRVGKRTLGFDLVNKATLPRELHACWRKMHFIEIWLTYFAVKVYNVADSKVVDRRNGRHSPPNSATIAEK